MWDEMDKAERQRLIVTIVSQHEIRSERQLVYALQELGCYVTQATVSRDIRQLELQKVRTELGRSRYVTSLRNRPSNPEQAASHGLMDFCLDTAVAQSTVVVRCELGSASTVARALDNLNHSEIIGTLAGDDTFVAFLRDVGQAEEMKRYLDRLRGV
jgi:transcriptional regulator of arginine metabolism